MTPSKICTSCGRSFEYRKKWAKNWDEVKYCSDECRKNKKTFNFESQILELLQKRNPGHSTSQTICPSEVLPNEMKSDKEMMEHVRRSARILVAEEKIEITQKGKPVDPDLFRGPIRLRLLRK